jgi:16S rRNA (cytosine1402-N4)-methyltransferase
MQPDNVLIHEPVLLGPTIEMLAPKKGEKYLDLTAGYGGHARAIIDKIGDSRLATLVDRDEMAINSLKRFEANGSRLIRSDFAAASEELALRGEKFEVVLVDLGVSSPQLDRAERGFSIKRDGPLDMRMDNRQELTAYDVVNQYSGVDLRDLIIRYGDERPAQAARIAKAIVEARPIMTTHELAQVIAKTYRGPRTKVHPATRTFQSIRIALNDELGQLSRLLPNIPKLLNSGGRVAIISFHSLEDRMVKSYFAEEASSGYEAQLSLIKGAIKGADYDVNNPRARSSTLRGASKI